MVRQEIVSGIKNAVERGYSLESATQSFINAGYNFTEVKEAAMALQGNLPPAPVNLLPAQQAPLQPSQQQKEFQKFQQLPSPQDIQKKSRGGKMIFLLIVVLVILVVFLLLTVFFKEQVNDFLKNIFSFL